MKRAIKSAKASRQMKHIVKSLRPMIEQISALSPAPANGWGRTSQTHNLS
jgi:hypothetical protein